MGKLEKILEIVSLVFGVFYYICEYATKKKDATIFEEKCEESESCDQSCTTREPSAMDKEE